MYLLSLAFPWLVRGLSLLGKAGAGLVFAVAFLYTTELFPTSNRQVVMGIVTSCAHIAAMLAPYAGAPLVSFQGLLFCLQIVICKTTFYLWQGWVISPTQIVGCNYLSMP